ncbi:acetyl-CoA C-acyltransferase [Phenylobacterium immobile]|uniref:acetyl-CoA C-acyltransferase n=1 Tax=Phenylobacterium immobile TaxID=21 RepID=UPI000ADC374D|nr:acetyl-CoA C-acyltransferase [Phenylobacterium immobile]
MANDTLPDVWLAQGLRTPFARAGGALAAHDALGLSVPVIRAMTSGVRPDLTVWGAVVPNLTWSNLAREALLSAGADATIPAFSNVMACATSISGAFAAAGMLDGRGRDLALVGGAEAMSRVQIGLSPEFSDDLRRVMEAQSMGQRFAALNQIKPSHLRLHVPKVQNRVTGKSMGEHTEEMAKAWKIGRAEQDALALASHQRAAAAWTSGFFADLVTPMDGIDHDGTVRADTSAERLAKLSPAFDRKSGQGTLTAGNSSPLTDGAAGVWVASGAGLARLPGALPRVRLVDYVLNAIDLHTEHLLMAPAYAIPQMLARNGLTYADVALWEIHEAFAAQVATHVKALDDADFLARKAGVARGLGLVPVERINPNGGSLALGHPFGATGARILSQAVKELAAMAPGAWGLVSVCADGGQGAVALLRNG